MPTLSDRIRLARAGTAVERAHVSPHALRYSVGHHSCDLITLLVLTWQAAHGGELPRSELLVAAAFHDVPECVTGDLPSPTKALLGDTLTNIEENVFRWLGVNDVGLTAEEGSWLKVCDRLELSLWAYEEVFCRGNLAPESWIRPSDISKWPAVFSQFYDYFVNNHKPVTWEDLKEAAGI